MPKKNMSSFLNTPLNVINVGLRSFAESLQAQGVPVTQVDWRPPLVPRLLLATGKTKKKQKLRSLIFSSSKRKN